VVVGLRKFFTNYGPNKHRSCNWAVSHVRITVFYMKQTAPNLQQLNTFAYLLLLGQESVTNQNSEVLRESETEVGNILSPSTQGAIRDQVLGIAPRSPQVQVLGMIPCSSSRHPFRVQVLENHTTSPSTRITKPYFQNVASPKPP